MAFTNALGASRTGYQNLLPRRPATPLSPTPLQLKLTDYLLSFNPRPPPLAFEAHATPVLLPAYPPLRLVPNPKLQAAHRLASRPTHPNPHPARRG